MTMSISPAAPSGNKMGPTEYRMDFAHRESGIMPSTAKQPKRTISPTDQQNAVNRCCHDVHPINGVTNNSVPDRTEANRSTCRGFERVNPNTEVASSMVDTARAANRAGRRVVSQMSLSNGTGTGTANANEYAYE